MKSHSRELVAWGFLWVNGFNYSREYGRWCQFAFKFDVMPDAVVTKE